jgi:hypothetical protein
MEFSDQIQFRTTCAKALRRNLVFLISSRRLLRLTFRLPFLRLRAQIVRTVLACDSLCPVFSAMRHLFGAGALRKRANTFQNDSLASSRHSLVQSHGSIPSIIFGGNFCSGTKVTRTAAYAVAWGATKSSMLTLATCMQTV